MTRVFLCSLASFVSVCYADLMPSDSRDFVGMLVAWITFVGAATGLQYVMLAFEIMFGWIKFEVVYEDEDSEE